MVLLSPYYWREGTGESRAITDTFQKVLITLTSCPTFSKTFNNTTLTQASLLTYSLKDQQNISQVNILIGAQSQDFRLRFNAESANCTLRVYWPLYIPLACNSVNHSFDSQHLPAAIIICIYFYLYLHVTTYTASIRSLNHLHTVDSESSRMV